MADRRTENIEKWAVNYYLSFHPELGTSFEKCVRPDFYNSNNYVGIEVTEFTHPLDAINHKIPDYTKHMTLEETEQLIRKKYKNYANDFTVLSVGNLVGITYGPHVLDRKSFIKLICAKHENYKDELNQYSIFILLCVSTGIEITEEWEAEEILLETSKILHDERFHIAILFQNSSGNWRLLEN